MAVRRLGRGFSGGARCAGGAAAAAPCGHRAAGAGPPRPQRPPGSPGALLGSEGPAESREPTLGATADRLRGPESRDRSDARKTFEEYNRPVLNSSFEIKY